VRIRPTVGSRRGAQEAGAKITGQCSGSSILQFVLEIDAGPAGSCTCNRRSPTRRREVIQMVRDLGTASRRRIG
jgi:hypothetical protein